MEPPSLSHLLLPVVGLGGLSRGYFTLKVRHVVVAARCVAVLAIVTRRR